MGKGKLRKFADMADNPLVVECPYSVLMSKGFALTGHWNSDFFHHEGPIVLELGCGRGEYTVGLARRFPEKNFIGVDIKGARMWHGACEALAEGMTNVGFLRTNIECIDHLFGTDEVDEIWLTFSDPQMKKPTKRLTSTYFLERYRRFLKDGGLVRVKTDSLFLYEYTKVMAEHNRLEIVEQTADLYDMEVSEPNLKEIRTYYEQMWMDKGIPIKYIAFRLQKDIPLKESDIEIQMDDYRSYNHEVVKEIKKSK